jgi:hypothetical protein
MVVASSQEIRIFGMVSAEGAPSSKSIRLDARNLPYGNSDRTAQTNSPQLA